MVPILMKGHFFSLDGKFIGDPIRICLKLFVMVRTCFTIYDFKRYVVIWVTVIKLKDQRRQNISEFELISRCSNTEDR